MKGGRIASRRLVLDATPPRPLSTDSASPADCGSPIARAETEAAAEAARQRELRETEEAMDEADADTVVTTDSDERR